MGECIIVYCMGEYMIVHAVIGLCGVLIMVYDACEDMVYWLRV